MTINLERSLLMTMANAIRILSMDAVQNANSGHPGMPMGMADVATVLFTKFLKYVAKYPHWADRDRFVLSAGHGSMLIYSLLYLTGNPEISLDDIKAFRQYKSKTPGHPEYGHTSGIETTTGPLGQGLATAVGMAIAERMMASEFGEDLCDHYTYAMVSDGCLMEGISHEAISLAGHLKLNKLVVLFDNNNISIDGSLELSCRDNQLERFKASGWYTISVDGHDYDQIENALERAYASELPTLIACKTIIGKGAPNKEGSSVTHGAPLGKDEILAARNHLGWGHDPFDVPDEVLKAWRSAGSRGSKTYQRWQERLASKGEDFVRYFHTRIDGQLSSKLSPLISRVKSRFLSEKPKLATRQSSHKVLEELVSELPELVGGSADLTGSVGTKTSSYKAITSQDFSGNYLHYGVREHGMAAAMNGIALHGGYVPYGGTFLVFSDYCRGSIRISALMKKRVIYVLTHDSIGLGEDGPTHQPVETLASLRAMPNLKVYRPADAVEVAEAWECALGDEKSPSALCLTRQGLPALREDITDDENKVARGAYVLIGEGQNRDITILATGSEVSLAVEAYHRLTQKGIKTSVVSMPCWEIFENQPIDYKHKVLGKSPRIAVEASVSLGWYKWMKDNDVFIGMDTFGASAPAGQLFEHFGITSKAIEKAALQLVQN